MCIYIIIWSKSIVLFYFWWTQVTSCGWTVSTSCQKELERAVLGMEFSYLYFEMKSWNGLTSVSNVLMVVATGSEKVKTMCECLKPASLIHFQFMPYVCHRGDVSVWSNRPGDFTLAASTTFILSLKTTQKRLQQLNSIKRKKGILINKNKQLQFVLMKSFILFALCPLMKPPLFIRVQLLSAFKLLYWTVIFHVWFVCLQLILLHLCRSRLVTEWKYVSVHEDQQVCLLFVLDECLL